MNCVIDINNGNPYHSVSSTDIEITDMTTFTNTATAVIFSHYDVATEKHVDVKLFDGQSATFEYGGEHEEGFSNYEDYYVFNDGVVEYTHEHHGRDCDGNHHQASTRTWNVTENPDEPVWERAQIAGHVGYY